MVPYIRLPFIEDFAQSLSLPGFDGSLGNRIDEDIGYAVIEHSIRNTILLEDEQRKVQTKKDSRLQMVPCRGKHGGSSYDFLFYRAPFQYALATEELFKSQDYSAGAMFCQDQYFAQGIGGWIVGPA